MGSRLHFAVLRTVSIVNFQHLCFLPEVALDVCLLSPLHLTSCSLVGCETRPKQSEQGIPSTEVAQGISWLETGGRLMPSGG